MDQHESGHVLPPVRGRARGRSRVRPRMSPADFIAMLERQSLVSNSGSESTLEERENDVGSVCLGISASTSIATKTANESEMNRGLRTTIRSGLNKSVVDGEEFSVTTNYFFMNKSPNFTLHQYRVDFNPEEDSTLIKKHVLRSQEAEIGYYIFDGHMLYTSRPIPKEKMELAAVSAKQEGQHRIEFKILIRQVKTVDPSSPTVLQFYNMVMRKAMTLVGMEELGRHFYDRGAAIRFNEDRLELWPGIITAIRNHDVGILLCAEVTHKVLRMSNVYELIQIFKSRSRGNQEEFERMCKNELIGTIVMTHYNRRTYKIDGIDFATSPTAVFRQQDGVMTSYIDYYLGKYNIQNIHEAQPMLVSNPKKKDKNKGVTGDIYLIPSLCNPTGLTDEVRKNFTLMRKLSEHLHMGPDKRKKKLDEFINKIKNTVAVKEEFDKWNVDFTADYVTAAARKYPLERIFMGPMNSDPVLGDKNADWSRQLKGRGMLVNKELKKWILFVPEGEIGDVEQLLKQLKSAGASVNLNVLPPVAVIRYSHNRILARIRNELNRRGEDIQFVFVVLTNNNFHTYANVKKLCILDFALGCQCCLVDNLNGAEAKGKISSICTNIMIQINAKLSGVPWSVRIPAKKLMVLGFHVYHCSERKGRSTGALVSTTDQGLSKYYSTVIFHHDQSELAKNLAAGVRESLEAYRTENNGELPDRVVLYREGVGESEIQFVLDSEIPQLKLAIDTFYNQSDQPKARLAVVIVTRKINARILLERVGDMPAFDNVPSGTVVDSTLTLPERYEFFLVSQSVNQGTVRPTNYHVVYDETEFSSEEMQKLSFKLCHLYYNWSGAIEVPAPCQYAHKLAHLTGIALNEKAPVNLATSLWYL